MTNTTETLAPDQVLIDCPDWCRRWHGVSYGDGTDGVHLTPSAYATVHDALLVRRDHGQIWLIREQLHPTRGKTARPDFVHFCDARGLWIESWTVQEMHGELINRERKMREAIEDFRLVEEATEQLANLATSSIDGTTTSSIDGATSESQYNPRRVSARP